jgi:AcrR family transcriptional regulator
MAKGVNPKRRYESPRRREQAATTRANLVAAAQLLFERDGYTATTMAAVAAEAGVSLKTVYLAFETKSGLLRAVWDTQLRGTRDIPVAEQPWYREAIEAPEAEQVLRLVARNSRAVKTRIGVIVRVIRDAAATDPDAHALSTLIESDFYANQRAIVQVLQDRGVLKDGLDVTKAADILWSLNHPDVWRLFVDVRGWTPDEWEQWFGDTTCAQLLRPR